MKAHQLCQSINNKKAVRGSSLAYFEDGQPDMSLYEGGRWGYVWRERERESNTLLYTIFYSLYSQMDEDNDDSGDSDLETSAAAISKKKTLDFFEEEFRKRRRVEFHIDY